MSDITTTTDRSKLKVGLDVGDRFTQVCVKGKTTSGLRPSFLGWASANPLRVKGETVDMVVVGIDGSACADVALEFATEEAALRGATLRIVCAWEIPSVMYPSGIYPSAAVEGFQEDAKTIVDKALARAAELKPSLACEGKVVEGQPADVILQEAQGAFLIVLGSRGRGGFASLLLGSVSQQVVHHASCPVTIVHDTSCDYKPAG
jgi:nucleotide-binding universal stress UspA family protein